MNRVKKYLFVPVIALALLVSACGKESLEKANLKVVTSVRAARQITTLQHDFGQITDEAYVKRLQGFKKVYNASDKFADLFVEYDEINGTNKQKFIEGAQYFIETIEQLLADGTLGVKNDASQAKFKAYLNVAYATLSSAKVVIAAVDKPVPISDVKVTKIDTDSK